MYVDESHSGKYTRYLLRDSYRQDGKVKHRTIANLSNCSPQEIQAIKLALQHKGDLTALLSLRQDVGLRQGLSVGAGKRAYTRAFREEVRQGGSGYG